MGDAALISGLINGLLSNLTPLIKDEFSLVWNFKKEVDKLSSTLSAIEAVLEDAERKRDKDKQTEVWLQKLKAVLYEVRDIVDECSFEDLRLQVKRLNASSSSTRKKVTNFITHPFSNTWSHLNIGHKIKNVREKIDQISSDRQKLHLCESNRDSKIDKFTRRWRETISRSSQQVYGRDKEKKYIIDILLNNTSSSVCVATKLSVLPIVGMGGIGKTTLAQMVFNDEKITKHFDPKIWVCVSDEFDIKLVIKSIIGETNETSLEILQQKIEDKLKRKKYLIVLDDVWNENFEAWDQLRNILDCGLDGAFVLTTTRKGKVAELMETTQHVTLSSLLEDDCWLLFEELAFVNGKPKPPNFINIGKEIVKKCKGVPLVAKTLGSQLGSKKSDEEEWRRIRDSEVWEISQKENPILSILKLSYYDLPYDLRRCFVFCAIFSKDTEIEKERLIQLWMAHGLITTEDDGNRIWNELCWRSFFQDEKEKNWDDGAYTITCMMHDLMHDLAISVMQNECFTMNAKRPSDGLGQEIRHVTGMKLDKTSVCSLKKIGRLQSIMFYVKEDVENVIKEFLSALKELPFLSLRVLELSFNVMLLEVEDSVQYQDLHYVGRLKHLRYLDISGCQRTALPDSICNLLNLQTLKLNKCLYLESLPKNTRDLINLRHLYLEGCFKLKYMPRGMRQLKHLKRLNLFVIGKNERCGQLDELKELDVGGSLRIENLGRVSDACIARGISMAKMTSINQLELSWTSNDDVDYNLTESKHEKISKVLEISTGKLKKLVMEDYKGVNPPKWVVGKSYPCVTNPERMDNENTIASNSDDNEMTVLFPLLEELKIWRMMNLRELVSRGCWSTGVFPNLCKLNISDCPKLGRLPPHLKALKDVSVTGECSDELLDSIWNLNGTLTHLTLSGLNKDVEHIVTVNNMNTSGDEMNGIEVVRFPLLEELTICEMKNLRGLVSPTIPSPGAFPNLRKLEIDDCTKLGALPPHLKALKYVAVQCGCSDEFLNNLWNLSGLTHLKLGYLNNDVEYIFTDDNMNEIEVVPFPLLEELTIIGMRGLVSPTIPSLRAFPNLCTLNIYYCPKLGALPPHLKSLKSVYVRGGCTEELLYSISNLSALTHLELQEIHLKSVLFGAGKALMFDDEIPSSSSSSQILGELGVRSTFQSLQFLKIWGCYKLRSLFDEEMMQGLTELNIWGCPELMISVEEFGKLNINNSLKRLWIEHCPKLVSSEEAGEFMALLRSIRTRIGPNKFIVDESIRRKIDAVIT